MSGSNNRNYDYSDFDQEEDNFESDEELEDLEDSDIEFANFLDREVFWNEMSFRRYDRPTRWEDLEPIEY